jgi:hypothetical protein
VERVLKAAVVLLVAVFFAGMWGLYLRRHLVEQPSTGLQAGYDNLLQPEENERNMTWGIYLGPTRVGRSHTRIVRQATSAVRIESTTQLSPGATRAVASITGSEEPVVMNFHAEVAPLRGLQSFHVDVEALGVKLDGRVEDESLVLSGKVGSTAVKESLPMGRKPVVASSFSPVSSVSDITEESIGQSWQVSIVQPLTGQVQQVTVTPVASTMVPVDLERDAEPERVFKLRFELDNRYWGAWVRADGEPLLQQLPPPLPLVLRREDINEKALQTLTL